MGRNAYQQSDQVLVPLAIGQGACPNFPPSAVPTLAWFLNQIRKDAGVKSPDFIYLEQLESGTLSV